jgi:DNA polymerase elongation subunit (family B)
MMHLAKSQSQTTAAAATFIKQIDSWIMELRGQNLRVDYLARKASQLMIKHRAANPTYRDGEAPWIDSKESLAQRICLQSLSMQPA